MSSSTDVTNGVNDVEIAFLADAADAIFRSDRSLRRDQQKRAHMVVDMQPVADILAIAIDGQGAVLRAR